MRRYWIRVVDRYNGGWLRGCVRIYTRTVGARAFLTFMALTGPKKSLAVNLSAY